MGEMADDMIEGCCCEVCGAYFLDDNGELYEHGYPVTCNTCWKRLSKQERKDRQRAERPTM